MAEMTIHLCRSQRPHQLKVSGQALLPQVVLSVDLSSMTPRIGSSIRQETIPLSWLDWFRGLARRTPAPSVPLTPGISIWKALEFTRPR